MSVVVLLFAVMVVTATAHGAGADIVSTVDNDVAPVMVRVDLDATQDSASKVIEVANAYPGRLIVIGVADLPWKVANYSTTKCNKLNGELKDLIKAIRSKDSGFELSVYGLPAQERGSISRSDATRINNKLSDVISLIDVFVPHPSSVRAGERSVRKYFVDKLSDVAEFAGKRSISVEVNKVWRRWHPHLESKRTKQLDRAKEQEREAIEKQIPGSVREAYMAVRGSDHALWDFDGNGVVNNQDWDRFLEKWDRWPELKTRDRDGDGRPDWKDLCPNDSEKKVPGDCGCGSEDLDSNDNGISDCIEPSPSVFVNPPATYTIGQGDDLELALSDDFDAEEVSVIFRSFRLGQASEGIWVDYEEPFRYANDAMDNVSPGVATTQALVRMNQTIVESVEHSIEFIDEQDDDDASGDPDNDETETENNGGGDSSDGDAGSSDGSDDDNDSGSGSGDGSSGDSGDDSGSGSGGGSSGGLGGGTSQGGSGDSSGDDDQSDDSGDDQSDEPDEDEDEEDSSDNTNTEEDGSFWSEAASSSDTRTVYVSSSEGDDSNSGYSTEDPVRTLEKGKSRMRDGFPDRLLLKRGDIWTDSFGGWTYGGRSASEPMIIGSYGSDTKRPKLQLTHERAMYLLGSPKHLWITSLHITAMTPTHRQGFLFHYSGSDGEDMLFEDLYIEGFNGNIMVDATNNATKRYKNMRFRRVVSVDAALYEDGNLTTSTGTQGLFLSYTDGTLIEECIFDHNGRSHDPSIEISGIFAHNIYIAADNKNFEMRGTISASAGSHGIKCMSGGEIRDCLFLRNPINVMLGHNDANPGGSVSLAENNIILDSQAINSTLPRGDGIHLMNLRDSYVRNNIIAGMTSQNTGGKGIYVYIDQTNACDDVRVIDNTVVDWTNRGIRVAWKDGVPYDLKFKRNHVDTRGDSYMCYLEKQELAAGVVFEENVYYYDESLEIFSRVGLNYWDFSDWMASVNDTGSTLAPYIESKWDGLSIQSYQDSIGQSPTLDAFMSKARKQRKGSWNDKYTAQAVQTYCFEERDSLMGSH